MSVQFDETEELSAERLRSLWAELRSRVGSPVPDEFWDLETTGMAEHAMHSITRLACRLAIKEGLCGSGANSQARWLYSVLDEEEQK